MLSMTPAFQQRASPRRPTWAACDATLSPGRGLLPAGPESIVTGGNHMGGIGVADSGFAKARPAGDSDCQRQSAQPSAYKLNTYSTVALRSSLSSGVSRSFVREVALGPDAIAIYCLPSTSNVIGGAPNPAPTLIFHSWSRVVSSKAATVPSMRARNTIPPAVASSPE